MNLLIDIGNTRVKWRSTEVDACTGEGVLENSELSEALIVEMVECHAITKMMISNVGKEAITSLFARVAEKLGLEFLRMKSQPVMAGVKFAYQDISRLGVDRCLAMAASFEHKGVMVIDAGSAITADYVTGDGDHQGGYILPGLQMLKVSLNSGTSRIAVDVSMGNIEPGCSTEECVGNGLTLMLQALMAGLIKQADAYGIKDYVVTGGDAEFLTTLCPEVAFSRRSNLVLDGLQKFITEKEGAEG